MADQVSSLLGNARHHCDMMLASVAHHLKGERGKSERLQRERDELSVKLARAKEHENDLIRRLEAERARLPECDPRPGEERSRTEEQDPKHRHRCRDVEMFERRLQKVKDDRVLTISQEWHKARLLREQDEQLLNLRNAMSRQADKVRQEQELTAQKSTENDALRQELDEVKRATEQCETRSKRKLAEVQDQIDAERSSWQHEIEMERKKRQRIEKSLERAKKQSESKNSASQLEIGLLKSDFCALEDELRGTHHDLRQAESSLMLQSKSLTEKEHEISRLLEAIEILKDGHQREQQQLRNELSVAQNDTNLANSTLAIASGDLEAMRQTLSTMQMSIASFAARGGAMSVIRLICQNLNHFTPGARKFCDVTHGEYGFVTDCGVLLCFNCLERSVPDGDGVTNYKPSSISFELDCSWCPSSCWTWERLTIPFSWAWQRQLEEFVECMDSLTTETLLRVSPSKQV